MKIIVAAGGRFHALNLASQLAQRNHLKHLFTFSYTRNDRTHIPNRLVSQIWPCRFLDKAFQRFRLGHMLDKTLFNLYKDTLFDSLVARQLKKSSEPFDIFVVWANYGLRSITQAKKRKALVIVESGSAHIKEQAELLTNEYQKYGLPIFPVNPKTMLRMTHEYGAADYITVPSTFARNSFIKHGISAERLLVVPCGMNLAPFFEITTPRTMKKFRVIFVGLLCLRKGIHYLIDAWNNLHLPEDQSELVLVGPMQADLAYILKGKKLRKNICFYGSTDQATLKNLYKESSVFVLPSIEDGFGMVMGEAMASGLPVICTTSTAGTDLVDDGITGYVIPPGDSQALADKLRWCYDHRHECITMGVLGRQAIQCHTHTKYGAIITGLYQELLNRKTL